MEHLKKDLQQLWPFLNEQEQGQILSLLQPTTEEKLAEWRTDPALYLQERLNIVLWHKLEEVCEAIRTNSKVAVKSANGVGKTEIVSALGLWWLECFTPSKLITTGSSWTSLADVLWPRIRSHIHKNGLFKDARVNDTEIKISSEHYAVAKSVDKAEGLMGFHSPSILQIVEESSGVEQEIADAIDGNHTGDNAKQLWIGNPLRADGVFYEMCTGQEFKVITISAYDHPNVQEGREVIAGAVTRESIEDKARRWCKPCAPNMEGATHLWWLGDKGWFMPDERYTARVLGEFPKTASDALFSREILDKCSNRELVESEPRVQGCDVARFGADETVICTVQPNGIEDFEAWRGKPTTETAGRLIANAREGIASTAVDDTGVGGGVTDLLAEAGVEYLAVNFGESADDSERFANKKAELYWQAKEELESNPDYSIPKDTEFIQQASEVKYLYDSKGRIAIESKEKYKKRTGRSPDKVEAWIIGLYALTNSGPSAPPTTLVQQPQAQRRYGKESME